MASRTSQSGVTFLRPKDVQVGPASVRSSFKFESVNKYSRENLVRILDLYVQGQSIEDICFSSPWAPSAQVFFYAWLPRIPEARRAYQGARMRRANAMVDETLKIADESGNPAYRIGARQWIAARLDPENWGSARAVEARVAAIPAPPQHSALGKINVDGLPLETVLAIEQALAQSINDPNCQVPEDDEGF